MINWTKLAGEVLAELECDLAVRARWLHYAPSVNELALVLERVFWSSLRAYEGIPTRVRIYLAAPEPLPDERFSFEIAKELTDDVIRRLSPAHGRQGGLVVRAVGNDAHVAGIHVRQDPQHPPPLLLCVESTSVGVLRVSSHMLHKLVEINRLEIRVIEEIERHRVRLPVARALTANTSSDRGQHSVNVAAMFIEIAESMERARSGGALWLLGEGDLALDLLAEQGVRVDMGPSWCEPFREEWENRTTTLRMVTPPVTDDVAKLYKIQECTQAWDHSRKALVAGGVAALARTDGAIVASAKPEVVAFGVVFNEFAKAEPRVSDAGPGMDPFEGAKQVAFETIGGSRHRSAARFCSTFAPASAIVASHDGGLTAFVALTRGEVARLRIPKLRH
jgi:hypothetical protein